MTTNVRVVRRRKRVVVPAHSQGDWHRYGHLYFISRTAFEDWRRRTTTPPSVWDRIKRFMQGID